MEPAACKQSLGKLRRVPVAGGHHWIAEDELSYLVPTRLGSIRRDDAQLVRERAGGRLTRQSDAERLVPRPRVLDAAKGVLAHAVSADDANAKTLLERRALVRRGRGGRVHRAQRRWRPGGLGLSREERDHGTDDIHGRD